jgi:hypothetical protein
MERHGPSKVTGRRKGRFERSSVTVRPPANRSHSLGQRGPATDADSRAIPLSSRADCSGSNEAGVLSSELSVGPCALDSTRDSKSRMLRVLDRLGKMQSDPNSWRHI